jgi:glycosyltransferase involved in cell wall biosynthesis
MGDWELLLVDNACEPPLEDAWDLSWHPNARHLREAELGVAAARRTGLRSAAADVIVFIDDDNVVDPLYLEEAVRIGRERPELGAWGSGSIVPEFELAPSPDVGRLVPNLALRQAPAERWGNVLPCTEVTPWGAGLCLRAEVAAAYRRHCAAAKIQIASRRGRQVLASGEDVEMCHVACRMGLGVGVFPTLKLTHLIPERRVSPDYLLGIFEGTLTSNWLLAYKWRGVLPDSPSPFRRLVSLCAHLLMERGFDRRIYLASRRAAAAARRQIEASRRDAVIDTGEREPDMRNALPSKPAKTA